MTQLTHRALVRLSPTAPGEDPRAFLQGLVTNDMLGPLPAYAALLTPQGKVIADFLVFADGADILLDVAEPQADALVKRLSMYRLRRAISIARDDALAAHWDAAAGGTPDPRLDALGHRWIAPVDGTGAGVDAAYLAHRLGAGVAEGADLVELLWLECNAVELHGVNFTKGCYVGQENTARMNWRQKINRRAIVVPLPQSRPDRQRAAYATHAVDHLRVEDITPDICPAWLTLPESEPAPPE
jgi:folate-binding protein YgfZ